MNIKPLLTYKNLGIKVDSLGETFKFPKDADTVDLIMGISKKGSFQISTIRSKSGNILKRDFSYKDDNGNCDFFEKTYNKNDTHFSTKTVHKHNNQNSSLKYTNYVSINNDLFITDETITNQKDFHSVGLYKKGKKPKKIEYNWNWDNFKPSISDIPDSIKENIELLPLFVSFESSERLIERIKHISKILKNKHDIQDIPVRIKMVYDTDKKLGLAGINGEIGINNKYKDSFKLLEILSHEYQHLSDFVNILRVREIAQSFMNMLGNNDSTFKDFIMKCAKKGLWTPNSDKEKFFKKLWITSLQQQANNTNYMSLELEKRAFEEQKRSMDFLQNYTQKLLQFLTSQD